MTLITVVLAAWGTGAALSQSYGLWTALGGTAVALAAVLVARAGRVDWGPGQHRRGIVIGLGAGAVMTAGTTVLFGPVTTLAPALAADVARLYTAFGAGGPLATAVALPVIVVCEEIVWRGAVYEVLSRRLTWLPAAAAGAGLYAAAHAPSGSPALVLTCLGAGFCWAALRGLTGSLPAVIAAHLLWDVAVLVVHPLAGPR